MADCVEKLFWNMEHKDVPKSLHLLDSIPNVNIWNEHGDTPLIAACRYRLYDVVVKLVKMGADVNREARRKGEPTPLLMSLFVGAYTCARYLIDHGAKVNVKDSNGDIPSLLATKRGYLDILKHCINNNINVNYANNQGETALILAARYGNEEIVSYLLSVGADVNHKDQSGNNAIFECFNVNIIHQLSKAGIDMNNFSRGQAPLTRALIYRQDDVAKTLVELGVDVNIGKTEYEGNLGIAVEDCQLDTVRIIAAKSNEKNLFDALVIAIEKNKPDYVQLLLDMGANPNLEDKHGDTALMIAIEKRVNTDIIKLLLPKVEERVFNWTWKQISKHYIDSYDDVIKVFNEYVKQ